VAVGQRRRVWQQWKAEMVAAGSSVAYTPAEVSALTPVREAVIRKADSSIRSPAALRLSYGVPADVAPYLKVRMKLPTPDSIYCARRKYDRQVDRKTAALCMKFTV